MPKAKEQNIEGLTRMEQMFVDYYTGVCLGDAYAAAIKAGYSKSVSVKAGYVMLTKPKIMAAINKVAKPLLDKVEINKQVIIDRLAARFLDSRTSTADMVAAGRLMAQMMPGAMAPTKSETKRTGQTLEEFLAAGKDKPKEATDGKDQKQDGHSGGDDLRGRKEVTVQ